MADDVEMAPWTTPRADNDGYPSVARFVARDPDHESYVFRRFNNLTARKLLYLQSELIELEAQQNDFDDEAARSTDPELRISMRTWEVFEANAALREEERKRKALAERIAVKLDEYHKALLLQQKIANLQRPDTRVLTAYRTALLGPEGKDPKLGGKAKYMLDSPLDLVILKPAADNDFISSYLRRHWFISTTTTSASEEGGGDGDIGAGNFHEEELVWLVNVLSTSIAAVLLIGSILALYFVTRPHVRLALVIGFIVLFAVGLSLSTSASRDSIFGATAAYAAVLVVFVSGNLSNGG